MWRSEFWLVFYVQADVMSIWLSCPIRSPSLVKQIEEYECMLGVTDLPDWETHTKVSIGGTV